MTTEEQDTGLAPGTREVDYADVAAGMRFLCGILRGGHDHEIVKVTADSDLYGSYKTLFFSGSSGCRRTRWVIRPGDAVICAAEPNTDAVDTQPIAVPAACGSRPWPIRPRTPKDTHRIPARDVVPGMQWPDTLGRLVTEEPRPGEDWATITAVGRLRGGWLNIRSGITGGYAKPDDLLYIRLPGRSLRERCCSCVGHGTDGDRCDDPALHAAGCPVAPVTGLHGGMRLWPEPFKGEVWRAFVYEGLNGWLCDTPTPHSKDTVVFPVHLGYPMSTWTSGYGDMIRQCFFLPPIAAPEPDRRMPGATADDPDLERVADLVSGGVIGPVRR